MQDYYVYAYIDPRNLEEFYYGKGSGSRKDAHLADTSDSPKVKRITAIRAAGAEPTVRVIARGLTEEQALLMEATLLWKLGKYTTNRMAGHFSAHFRPHDTLHRELAGFDFQNRLYYFNIGHGEHRLWEDCRRYSFISAGHGRKWRDAMCQFRRGDVFAAYLKGHGFVGIGRIQEEAQRVNQIQIAGRPLLTLCPVMAPDCESAEKSEYVAKVEWIHSVAKDAAKTTRKFKLYTTPLLRASLDGQPKTVEFLSKEFGVDFPELLK
jgi:hypothetical protein